MGFPPEQIYAEDLTHVNFAFASISEYERSSQIHLLHGFKIAY